jgi:hypothetical protein
LEGDILIERRSISNDGAADAAAEDGFFIFYILTIHQ